MPTKTSTKANGNTDTEATEPTSTETTPVVTEIGTPSEGSPDNGSTTTGAVSLVKVNSITAYRFAKIANAALTEVGHKELPPQMFYSYAKKGMLGTEAKPLTEEYASQWVEAYLSRKATKATAEAE
jgi:hypothetical protein